MALASEDVVVFACTIQRNGLKAKFKNDIDAICTQGTPVDRIYIFATEDIAASLRHNLEEWALDQHRVKLQIIDGLALAELLAEPDLYWIARQYLNLPTELAPQVIEPESDLPEWYIDLRDYWQNNDSNPSNLGDLFDLRHGLRHAIPPGPARADLAGWLALITRLAEQTPVVDVRLHAVYEIVTARYRGTADLRTAESLIRTFMTEFEQSTDPTILFNASVMIQLCSAAAAFGHTDIPLPEILEWIPHLHYHLAGLLSQDWGPNTRAALLQAAAHVALQFDYSDIALQPSDVSLSEIDEQYGHLIEAIDQGTMQQHLDAAPLLDIDEGMQRLVELVELLPDAPAFPIDTVSAIFDLLSPSLLDHPLYRQVCDGFDDAVKRLDGDIAVGERCRQRAQALHKAGNLLGALREFHVAKVNWFHGDTLFGTLRAMANIMDIYCALGMYLAAKKYALAMAAIAQGSLDPSDREFVPIALFSASDQDNLAGAWVSSANLAAIASLAHMNYAPDAVNLDRHQYVLDAVHRQAISTLVAHQTRPDFEPALWEILNQGPTGSLVQARRESLAAMPVRNDEEWMDWLSDKAGAPFSDVGPVRIATFHALGVRWHVHSRNEQNSVLALEDFTSTLQVLLVEFASLDPVVLAQDVDIEIRTYSADERPINTYLTRMDGDRRLWLLHMPAEPERASDAEILMEGSSLHLAFQVLIGNSLLDVEQFSKLMETAADNGLFNNLEVGRPYRELAHFRTQSVPPLAATRYQPLRHPARPNPRKGSQLLEPRSEHGPGYSAAKAQAILTERYELLPDPIRYTVPELLKDNRIRALFQQLRAEGWKDWHLLSVVLSLSVTHRIEAHHGPVTAGRVAELRSLIVAESRRHEEQNDPRISAATITREAMEVGIRAVAVSSLPRWNLTLHHGDTEAEAVMQVLGQRYGFWADDITHPEIFPELSTTDR
ncbi:hypothetical protein EEB12_29795 [Rhodococcus sp. WS1]|nr:hypothetical protein EEB12_29795 [Rhodococcus sp. WS1]